MNRIILNETSYFGAGCRSVIAVEAARRGFKKAFFVTDKDLIKFGVAAEIIKVFDENKKIVDSWKSKETTHKIEGLEVGKTYTLEEKIAPKKEELPKGYKISPVYIETKSRRLQLLLKPSIFKKLKQTADKKHTSVNDLVNSILEESLN